MDAYRRRIFYIDGIDTVFGYLKGCCTRTVRHAFVVNHTTGVLQADPHFGGGRGVFDTDRDRLPLGHRQHTVSERPPRSQIALRAYPEISDECE